MQNKRNMIIIIAIIAVLLVSAVTAVFLVNNGKLSTEAGLAPLEYDAGNVADDEWTARY